MEGKVRAKLKKFIIANENKKNKKLKSSVMITPYLKKYSEKTFPESKSFSDIVDCALERHFLETWNERKEEGKCIYCESEGGKRQYDDLCKKCWDKESDIISEKHEESEKNIEDFLKENDITREDYDKMENIYSL